MSTERDTHFSGAAKLLWERLHSYGLTNIADDRLPVSERDRINREIEQTTQEVIAQFSYDLAWYILESEALQNEFLACVDGNSDLEKNTDLLQEIPDLTEWPTPPTSAPQDRSPG
jgi:hypothetical protein